MKRILEVCLIFAGTAAAQDTKPVLQKGIHVRLPKAHHAVKVEAADASGATVVSVTHEGKVFLGTREANDADLTGIREQTVYLKVDARVPLETFVPVLDALNGHRLVLLTEAPDDRQREGIVPPYGVVLTAVR